MNSNKVYIIDGYNVLRTGDKYAKLAGYAPNFNDWQDSAFNAARDALLNDSALIDGEVFIVYDGKKQQISSVKVKVIFTDDLESADSCIERLAYKNAEGGVSTANPKKRRVIIVSNDSQIRFTTSKNNISHMSVSAFCKLVEQETEIVKPNYLTDNESNNGISDSNYTVEQIIKKDTLKKLQLLRDSLG